MTDRVMEPEDEVAIEIKNANIWWEFLTTEQKDKIARHREQERTDQLLRDGVYGMNMKLWAYIRRDMW